MPIQYIRSNITEEILHIVFTSKDVSDGRTNISPESEKLQIAAIKLHNGQTFKAHKHLPTERLTKGTAESWCVMRGRVRVILYDLDDQILREIDLETGDLTFTLKNAGHNYLCLEDDTLVYEFKNGPYMGIEKDKVFI